MIKPFPEVDRQDSHAGLFTNTVKSCNQRPHDQSILLILSVEPLRSTSPPQVHNLQCVNKIKVDIVRIWLIHAKLNCKWNQYWKSLTVVSSSWRTWSYSLIATQKIIAVTSSKQWIHFLRSDLWPPTSNNLKLRQWTSQYGGHRMDIIHTTSAEHESSSARHELDEIAHISSGAFSQGVISSLISVNCNES